MLVSFPGLPVVLFSIAYSRYAVQGEGLVYFGLH